MQFDYTELKRELTRVGFKEACEFVDNWNWPGDTVKFRILRKYPTTRPKGFDYADYSIQLSRLGNPKITELMARIIRPIGDLDFIEYTQVYTITDSRIPTESEIYQRLKKQLDLHTLTSRRLINRIFLPGIVKRRRNI